MKKLQLIFLSIFILCSFNLIAQDSTRVEKDSKDNNEQKKINFSVFGGVGVLINDGYFRLSFNSTPIYYAGLDYPITESNNWTIQLKAHNWLANSKNQPNKDLYYKLTNNLYSQLALSAYIRWYYLNIGNFRSSMKYGFYSSLFNKVGYKGIDVGLGIDYLVDKELSISIEGNMMDWTGENMPGTFSFFDHFSSSVSLYLYYNLSFGL